MTTTTAAPIAPADVHATLARYILADGYEFVFDFEKSRGAWVHDAKSGRDTKERVSVKSGEPILYSR